MIIHGNGPSNDYSFKMPSSDYSCKWAIQWLFMAIGHPMIIHGNGPSNDYSCKEPSNDYLCKGLAMIIHVKSHPMIIYVKD